MTDDAAEPGRDTRPFRVAFAPGVTPGKWARTWEQRLPGTPLELLPTPAEDQLGVLYDGRADMSFVRLPVDREGLSLIPLYHEVPVVVVPQDHVVAAFEEVSVDDLADEHLLQDPDDVPEWRDVATELRDGSRLPLPDMTLREAVEVVASGGGIVVVPMSLARLHHRKDVTYRPVTGVAESQVGLAWPADATDERIETFIGIVRGRTERSSRAGEPAGPKDRASSGKAAARSGGTKSGKAGGKPARQAGSRSAGKRPAGGGRSGRGGRRAGGR